MAFDPNRATTRRLWFGAEGAVPELLAENPIPILEVVKFSDTLVYSLPGVAATETFCGLNGP